MIHSKSIYDLFVPNRVVNKQLIFYTALFQIGLFFFFWNYYHGELLPSPIDVVLGMKKMIFEEKALHELIISTEMILRAMGVSLLISLFVSYISTLQFFKTLGIAVTKFRFFSSIGFTFFFTIITSGGENLKTAILVFVISSFFITSMMAVINSIQQKSYNYARTMRMGDWESLWYIVVRGKLGDVFEIARQTFAIGWGMVAMVEGLSRSGGGIGPILLNENKQLHLDTVFAMQIMVFVVGIFSDYLIGVIKNIFCAYDTDKKYYVIEFFKNILK